MVAPRRDEPLLARRGRVGHGGVACVLAAIALFAPACGGIVANPSGQTDPSQLVCLVTLQSECCSGGSSPPGCIGNFAAAEQCSSWAKSAVTTVFPAPCQGMTAVRVVLTGNNYASFFVFDGSGALYAIGDNATSSSAAAIECGAGPSGFVVPSACAALWSGTTGATGCLPATTAATSVCR